VLPAESSPLTPATPGAGNIRLAQMPPQRALSILRLSAPACALLLWLPFRGVRRLAWPDARGQSMFEVGRLYDRRKDIHSQLGGQQQGGICTPPKCTRL
jgi:hypothetical protein